MELREWKVEGTITSLTITSLITLMVADSHCAVTSLGWCLLLLTHRSPSVLLTQGANNPVIILPHPKERLRNAVTVRFRENGVSTAHRTSST